MYKQRIVSYAYINSKYRAGVAKRGRERERMRERNEHAMPSKCDKFELIASTKMYVHLDNRLCSTSTRLLLPLSLSFSYSFSLPLSLHFIVIKQRVVINQRRWIEGCCRRLLERVRSCSPGCVCYIL